MSSHPFLQYAVVLLLVAVIAVPLARRWRLGAVVGYLAAGVLIGPDGLGLLGENDTIAEISELGIVLMLFVIGLELSPQRLWVMRRQVFGMGSLQLLLTALALGGIAVMFGLRWKPALIVGLGLALSSTAIALQVLAERKELNSEHGRLGFSILLFQDVAAIPILALIPVLAAKKIAPSSGLVDDVVDVVRIVLVIAAVVVGGRYLLRPLFRATAATRIPEVFTASALLVVMGTAWIMEAAGMSMSMGAFLAGVLLADSEYRHEIEAQIDPFKGLLLGLFFISVGMSADLQVVTGQPVTVFALLAILIVVKAVLLFGLARWPGGLGNTQAAALAAVLCQGGEFAFVVFTLEAANGLITAAQRDLLIVVVTLSMALTPLLVSARARWIDDDDAPRQPAFEPLDVQQPRVVIAGFGRVGQIVARVLRANHIPFTAIEHSIEQVEFSRRFGSPIFYGDPTRADLLRAVQIDKAEVFVVATDDPEANIRTARLVKRMYPHVRVFARARNRQHVYRLMDLGVEVVRETFHSSLVLSRDVLASLGMPEEQAERRIALFREHDENLLRAQHLVYDDEAAVMQTAREARDDLERLFEADSSKETS
ncbi:MAG: glutathione-regulated potassium-efflux system protein KefB [Rhodanobacter denitrificans]|uniref:Glutathione-regulated potassium-efflux system protein KefB n=1 Tax=Rhodanobacter denitrificans TaxID=666685 RepID=A0A2W5MS69_9GAMM|nr:MAG: glutathione-regulated potassium-efflux system protein KefB [Rhodanobacter denitrificans]